MSYDIPPDEKELVTQCLGNDRVAQHQLYLKYKDAMYTILYRILNDETEATDALQETFIAVFKGLNSFRFQSTLGAWIKTIAIRTGVAMQKKQRQLYSTDIDELKEDGPVVWPQGLTAEALEEAMAKLPAGYRTTFVLIEVEGYSHKEVGAMLNVSEGTSKSQLYHAKRALQKMLEEFRYE